MSALRILVVAWIAAAACESQAPVLDVRTEVTQVEFGRRFTLSVLRRFAVGEVVPPWDDAWLAPLALREVGREVRDEAGHREERREFDAFAFRVGRIVVPAAPAVAATVPLSLEVRSALGPDAGVDAELPADLAMRSVPWLPYALMAAVLLGLSAAMQRWWRRLPQRATSTAIPAAPRESALARARRRLEVLRASTPSDAAEIDAFYIEASATLREFVEERFAVRAPEMTTEEFLGSPATVRALEAGQRELLGGFLAECDLVKFARVLPSSGDRARLVDAAITFLSGGARTTGGGT